VEAIIPAVVSANVHPPNEAALPAACNRRYTDFKAAIEFLIVLIAGNLLPVHPVRRRLDEPRFQMVITRTTTMRPDCVVSWHNPLFLEVVAYPIVSRMRNIEFRIAIS
jgi:hypothetical protein